MCSKLRSRPNRLRGRGLNSRPPDHDQPRTIFRQALEHRLTRLNRNGLHEARAFFAYNPTESVKHAAFSLAGMLKGRHSLREGAVPTNQAVPRYGGSRVVNSAHK